MAGAAWRAGRAFDGVLRSLGRRNVDARAPGIPGGRLRTLLCGLLVSMLVSMYAVAANALPAPACHAGDACSVPGTACMAADSALPARLAPQPRTPSIPASPAAVHAPSPQRAATLAILATADPVRQRLYLLTARLRR